MKLNIANPASGAQKKIEIEDEHKLQFLWDKRMAEEIQGETLGDEFKGYVFKITGGNDKEGFPMRQGVLVNKRVRLLLRRGMPCYKPKKKGEKRRKSVRGCIVGPDLAVLSLVIVKRGPQELPGLTDVEISRRLGPKRLGKIRKMFNLSKDDDPRDYIVRRKVKTKSGNVIIKKPKIQRLLTPLTIHRRKEEKKQVEARKKKSYQNRVNYFNRLTKKVETVKKAKQTIEKAINQKGTGKQPPKKKPAKDASKPKPTKEAPKSGAKSAKDQTKPQTKPQAKPQTKPQGKQQGKPQTKPKGKPQGGQGKPQGGQAKPQGGQTKSQGAKPVKKGQGKKQ